MMRSIYSSWVYRFINALLAILLVFTITPGIASSSPASLIHEPPDTRLLTPLEQESITDFQQQPQARTYILSLASTFGGTTNPVPGTSAYTAGTNVPIQAVASQGWSFAGWTWTGGGNPLANPSSASTTLIMNASRTVSANFQPGEPSLRTQSRGFILTMSVNGGGSVTPSVGTSARTAGATIPIVATASQGWTFASWSWTGGYIPVANPTSASTTVTMDASKKVTANFLSLQPVQPRPPQTFLLTMSIIGTGSVNPAVGTSARDSTRTSYGYWGTGGSYDTSGGYYGRLWEIKTVKTGGSTLQDVKHTWDTAGNLTKRENVTASETENFTYDDLDRLLSVSGAYSESYTYNNIGNTTNKGGQSYTYGSSKPHAVTSAGSTGYSYDNNGNMTARGSQTLTWDVENRLTTVTGGVSYVYDGSGSRVKKTEGGSTILYINKYYEKNTTTATVTLYYYLGDKMAAYKEGSTLRYVYKDHLTGTSVGADTSGNPVGTITYKPYGETRSSSGTLPSQKFTGQRLDDIGLYYYGARYYDAGLGRFISADTIVPNPYNPQGLNRYSYVINNPLKYTDSSGHGWWSVVADVASIIFDVYQLATEPTWTNAGFLALDVTLTMVPIIPAGAGPLAKGTGKALKAVEKGKNVERIVEGTGKVLEGAKDTAKLAGIVIKTEKGLIKASEGYESAAKLKKAIGSPGESKIWHHIVEQSQINRSGFDAKLVHNPKNVIALDEATNIKINAYYSSKQDFTGRRTVRDWLSGQSYEAQHAFGMDILKKLQ